MKDTSVEKTFLPPGWSLVPLGELADLSPGIPRPKIAASRLTPRACITEAHLSHRRPDQAPPLIVESSAKAASAGPIAAGDVIISAASERGLAVVWEGGSESRFIDQSLLRARPDHTRLEGRYLAAHLRAFPRSASRKRAAKPGPETPRALVMDLSRYLVRVPPLHEQRRISDALEEFDQRLEPAAALLARVTPNLERYAAVLIRTAGSGRLAVSEATLARKEQRAFESGSELVARMVEEKRARQAVLAKLKKGRRAPSAAREKAASSNSPPLSPSPEGWSRAPFDTLLAEPLRLGRAASKASAANGVLVVTAEGVIAQDFTARLNRFTDAPKARLSELWLEAGDLLIVRTGPTDSIGRCALYTGPSQFAVFADTLFRARIAQPIIAAFVTFALGLPEAREALRAAARPAARKLFTVTASSIGALQLPIPPLPEQERIVAELGRRLAALDDMHKAVETGARRAARLERAVLRRTFDGHLPFEATA
jgi:type I restriction enzyme S subunit